MPTLVEKLISGGQTGADRAALDVAIRRGLQHGGWCPRGRKAEDGPIGEEYQLNETPSDDYIQRTECNVRDSDGTVVFTLSSEVTGGSLSTIEFARKYGKPWLHLSKERESRYASLFNRFVRDNEIKTLNVAGSRESKEPGIYDWVRSVIGGAFF